MFLAAALLVAGCSGTGSGPNTTTTTEVWPVADGTWFAFDAQFALISGSITSEQVLVDAEVLAQVYEGTDTGELFHGVPAGAPFAMDVDIEYGSVDGAEAVYLP